MKISFLSFAEGDIALFLPAGKGVNAFIAFNCNCPLHYLAQESLVELQREMNNILTKENESKDKKRECSLLWLVGRIVWREEMSGNDEIEMERVEERKRERKEYGVRSGDKYVKLYIERLYQHVEYHDAIGKK